MAISLFYAILSSIFVTIARVKFKQMPKFYISFIFLVNQSKEIGVKHVLVFGSRGGQLAPKCTQGLITFSHLVVRHTYPFNP